MIAVPPNRKKREALVCPVKEYQEQVDATLRRLHPTRRAFVKGLLLMGGMAPALMAVVRSASAFSERPITPGVQEFEGDFRINGTPAHRGQIIHPNDVATTGANSSAIVIVGQHAFLIRASSRIRFYPTYFVEDGRVSGVLQVATGAMLAVFGKNKSTTIETPLLQLGIRGTGCYVDSRPDRNYACVCYGRANLIAAPTGDLLETVTTTYHDEPRYIFPPGAPQRITPAPVIDHTDAELRLLESVVNRTPPFDDLNDPYDDRY